MVKILSVTQNLTNRVGQEVRLCYSYRSCVIGIIGHCQYVALLVNGANLRRKDLIITAHIELSVLMNAPYHARQSCTLSLQCIEVRYQHVD